MRRYARFRTSPDVPVFNSAARDRDRDSHIRKVNTDPSLATGRKRRWRLNDRPFQLRRR
jgi:hypothetical protein